MDFASCVETVDFSIAVVIFTVGAFVERCFFWVFRLRFRLVVGTGIRTERKDFASFVTAVNFFVAVVIFAVIAGDDVVFGLFLLIIVIIVIIVVAPAGITHLAFGIIAVDQAVLVVVLAVLTFGECVFFFAFGAD